MYQLLLLYKQVHTVLTINSHTSAFIITLYIGMKVKRYDVTYYDQTDIIVYAEQSQFINI